MKKTVKKNIKNFLIISLLLGLFTNINSKPPRPHDLEGLLRLRGMPVSLVVGFLSHWVAQTIGQLAAEKIIPLQNIREVSAEAFHNDFTETQEQFKNLLSEKLKPFGNQIISSTITIWLWVFFYHVYKNIIEFNSTQENAVSIAFLLGVYVEFIPKVLSNMYDMYDNFEVSQLFPIFLSCLIGAYTFYKSLLISDCVVDKFLGSRNWRFFNYLHTYDRLEEIVSQAYDTSLWFGLAQACTFWLKVGYFAIGQKVGLIKEPNTSALAFDIGKIMGFWGKLGVPLYYEFADEWDGYSDTFNDRARNDRARRRSGKFKNMLNFNSTSTAQTCPIA